MRRAWLWIAMLPVLLLAQPLGAAQQEYLYQRDVTVPAYQTLREFFDMPNRPGNYEVTLLSEGIGPLTFRVTRVRGEHEQLIGSKRSYRVGAHDFQQRFDNPQGADDLMVEISNSNPAAKARVSLFVVELP